MTRLHLFVSGRRGQERRRIVELRRLRQDFEESLMRQEEQFWRERKRRGSVVVGGWLGLSFRGGRLGLEGPGPASASASLLEGTKYSWCWGLLSVPQVPQYVPLLCGGTCLQKVGPARWAGW